MSRHVSLYLRITKGRADRRRHPNSGAHRPFRVQWTRGPWPCPTNTTGVTCTRPRTRHSRGRPSTRLEIIDTQTCDKYSSRPVPTPGGVRRTEQGRPVPPVSAHRRTRVTNGWSGGRTGSPSWRGETGGETTRKSRPVFPDPGRRRVLSRPSGRTGTLDGLPVPPDTGGGLGRGRRRP